MSSLFLFLMARLSEPTTKAALAAGITAAAGSYAGGLGITAAAVAFATALVPALCPEAKGVVDAVAKVVSGPTIPPTGAVAAALALLIGAGSLGACTSTGTLSPAEARVIQVACRVDALVQPVLVTLAPEAFPGLAPLAGTDQALVHPAVVALCKAAGGTPSAVTAAS
jgi:hypothetical protein